METTLAILAIFTVLGVGIYRHNNRPKSAGEVVREFEFLQNRLGRLKSEQIEGAATDYVRKLRQTEIQELEEKIHSLRCQP